MKALRVVSSSQLVFEGKVYACAIGKAGFAPADEKREGDLKTPTGIYALRELWYRADKVPEPVCALPKRVITPADGWCDDARHEAYNRHIIVPSFPRKRESSTAFDLDSRFRGNDDGEGCSFEHLHRDDDVYDLIVPLGHNDSPPVAGRGSAIFLHVAKPDYAGTEGCVALAKEDLLEILAQVGQGSVMEIAPV